MPATPIRGKYVKRRYLAGLTGLVLISSLVAGISSANAVLRVPKASWPACSVSTATYCVDSVVLTDASGNQIPLTWVPSGQQVPQTTETSGTLMAPLAFVDKTNKVVANNWWEIAPNRDVLLSGTATFQDATALINTPNMPAQGAKYDPVAKTWDSTEPADNWNWPQTCQDPTTNAQVQSTRGQCIKGAILVIQNNEMKYLMQFPTAAQAQQQLAMLNNGSFVDAYPLAQKGEAPSWGSTYDPKAQTFSRLDRLVIPQWLSDQAVQQNWIIGGPATAPIDTSTASAVTPDTSSATTGPVAGRPLAGRWTTANWNKLGLNSLGYDGLFVDAKAANEFVNHVFMDVNPTLDDATNKTTLAAQPGNKNYATNLDPDVTIAVKLRTGDIKTGVTVAVGVDTTVQQGQDGSGSYMVITGNPVSVAIAKQAADCTGEAGVAVANVRQFQTLIVVQNDTSGFGVDGTSGNMYVGSNGTCSLSTPIWNGDTKTFTWTTASPHFAADGQTQNKGFYKAVIPFQDAALLWGLTNPADAATALTVSVSTEAGGSTAAISVISAKAGNIVIDVSGFGYSKPRLSIAIKPHYKPSKKSITSLPQAKITVTCVLGKTTKKLTAVAPVCPKGYKKLI